MFDLLKYSMAHSLLFSSCCPTPTHFLCTDTFPRKDGHVGMFLQDLWCSSDVEPIPEAMQHEPKGSLDGFRHATKATLKTNAYGELRLDIHYGSTMINNIHNQRGKTFFCLSLLRGKMFRVTRICHSGWRSYMYAFVYSVLHTL